MASRGSIPLLMERAGIQSLPPAEAAPLVGDLLLSRVQGELVVAGDLGMMQRKRPTGLDVLHADRVLREGRAEHTMFSHLTAFDPLGDGLTLEAKLDPEQLHWLQDHSIRGIPVLPGVAGIEGFTRAARHIANTLSSKEGKLTLEKLEDVHFLAPFKFYGGKARSTTWQAKAFRTDRGIEIEARLLSFNQRIPGENKSLLHFTGRVILREGKVERKGKQALPEKASNQQLTSDEIYRLLFHGPSFQILSSANASEDGVVASLNLDLLRNLTKENSSMIAPMLIESCFQTVGLYEAGLTGRIALPASVGTVTIHNQTIGKDPLFSEILADTAGTETSYSGRVIDTHGNLYIEIDDYRTVAQAAVAEEAVLLPIRNMVNEARS